jgi:hypothetical protein
MWKLADHVLLHSGGSTHWSLSHRSLRAERFPVMDHNLPLAQRFHNKAKRSALGVNSLIGRKIEPHKSTRHGLRPRDIGLYFANGGMVAVL